MPEPCPYCEPTSEVLRAALRRQREGLDGLTAAELCILVADLRMEVLALKWSLRQEKAGRTSDDEAWQTRLAQTAIDERRACAAIAESRGRDGASGWWTAAKIAEDIMARGTSRKKGGS